MLATSYPEYKSNFDITHRFENIILSIFKYNIYTVYRRMDKTSLISLEVKSIASLKDSTAICHLPSNTGPRASRLCAIPARDAHSILVWCWINVADGGPTLNQWLGEHVVFTSKLHLYTAIHSRTDSYTTFFAAIVQTYTFLFQLRIIKVMYFSK